MVRERVINKRLNVLTLGWTEINGNNSVTMHIFISLGRDRRQSACLMYQSKRAGLRLLSYLFYEYNLWHTSG